jgi:hypothetical protein
MDQWGEIDEPQSGADDVWGGDISDHNDEFKTEVTFEQKMQSSETNTCGSLIIEEPGKKDEFRKAMAALGPIERIKMNINKIIHNFKENGIIDLSPNQRNQICNSVDEVSQYDMNPMFLNPLAFVLGYIVCRKNVMITDDERETSEEKKRQIKRRSKGTKISEEEKETKEEKKRQKVREKKAEKFSELFGNVKDEFATLQQMNEIAGEYAVYAPDVIRYGQLWLKITCNDDE